MDMKKMAAAKPMKNNAKALQLRQEGNQLFRKKQYDVALTKYTESLCWAESDSEHLGIAYGNISATFYEQQEYEYALAYISLAKRHNYPERLMSKLEARESNCLLLKSQRVREENEAALSQLYPKLTVNVEVNPRIPYIAKGMHVQEDPWGGTMMIADRDFKVGDVILNETSLLGCLNPTHCYRLCAYCLSSTDSGLIPCSGCVSTVYCSEQCLERGWNTFHRFECDITQELHETVRNTGRSYTGVRMFFYGLSLFKDDVEKMMEFHKANPRTGSDPLKLDFVNYDPMEEFKAISTAKHNPLLVESLPVEPFACTLDMFYRRNAMIKVLFNTKAKKDFMLRCFIDYLKAFPYRFELTEANEYFTIATNFKMKPYDDANLAKLRANGMVKLVVHRAIKKGEMLTAQLNMYALNYECDCNGSICRHNNPNGREYSLYVRVLQDPNIDYVAKWNAHQQFIQANSHWFTRCFFKEVVQVYHSGLVDIFLQQLRDELRSKATQRWENAQAKN